MLEFLKEKQKKNLKFKKKIGLKKKQIKSIKTKKTILKKQILQRFYQNLQARALDSEAPLQALDPMIAKYLTPPDELFQKAEPKLKKFEELFPFKIIRFV